MRESCPIGAIVNRRTHVENFVNTAVRVSDFVAFFGLVKFHITTCVQI